MELSVALAKIIGPILVAMSLGALIYQDYYRKAIEGLLKHGDANLLAGIIALLLGLGLLVYHNLWVADWRVLITLFGWLMVLEGVFRLLLPSVVTGFAGAVAHRKALIPSIVSVLLVSGAVLVFFGYTA